VSRRVATWVLFGVFVLTVPLPIPLVGPGLVPVARFVMLGALVAAVQVFVRAGGEAASLIAVFWVPALVYGAGLWLLAALVARALARGGRRALTWGTLALAAACLLVALRVPLYQTPFAADRPRATLAGVLR
jgi:hypothetical protein